MFNKHLQVDALFQTLIATAVDGIIVIDGRGTIQIYSAACERLFGYTAAEVIGSNVKMLMPSPYREGHDDYIHNYQGTGVKRIIGIGREVVGQRKDGSTFPMYLSVGEGLQESEVMYVGIIHDLTSRNLTTRRMQEIQNELLHVSRLSAMGQMTAALAHELNQPLTAVLNYINAARRTAANVDEPQTQRMLELLDKAATQTSRAGQIIRQLRAFVEKRESARNLLNMNTVVEEAIALAAIGSADADVRTIVELAPDLPPVMIDKVQMQQVIINLVRNGVEAMQQVARRELAVRTLLDGEGGVEVRISDTGQGLPPEVASRLFHPFVTTKEKGMGIGLSICATIIEAHGGHIWSTPGEERGTNFHFSLPAAGTAPRET